LAAAVAVVAEPSRSSKMIIVVDAVAVAVVELSRSRKTIIAVAVAVAVMALQSASLVQIAADATGTEVAIMDGAERPSFFAPCRRDTALLRSAVADAALSSPRGSAPTALS
jgi:hypothetical protein